MCPPGPFGRAAPQFHVRDLSCGENDPNGPVFDPVHGVVHHFYQIHLAAPPGHGPDYGHFVSKDFVTWAELPVAIWNGVDASTGAATPYDNEAIFTGSAVVVDGAGPGGKGPGVVNIYPGLCNKNDWPGCTTGTLLAQAVPADYAGDELLVNWTKPSYNPIIEGTQRDPSTPWKDPTSGEWRLRTFDSIVYGSASDADLLAGKWYTIGTQPDFRQCECPSVYPLPAATPGTEDAYAAAARAGALPTTVHKTSCGGDWWQLGTYSPAPPKTLGAFYATAGCAAQTSARNSARPANSGRNYFRQRNSSDAHTNRPLHTPGGTISSRSGRSTRANSTRRRTICTRRRPAARAASTGGGRRCRRRRRRRCRARLRSTRRRARSSNIRLRR